MKTRWDELAAQLRPLADAFALGDLALARDLADRAGWGQRPVDAPLLPSGLRHGVPWGVSLAMSTSTTALRVFLEAQADPPSPAAYLAAARTLIPAAAVDPTSVIDVDAARLWHAVAFHRDAPPAFHAYACVPDRPALGWAWLARRGHDVDAVRAALPPTARVTIVSADLSAPAGRDKLYVLLPATRIADLPFVDDAGRRFAHAMHPGDAPIGWLLSLAFRAGHPAPSAVALHFAAAVHGTADLPARLAAHLAAAKITQLDRAFGPHLPPLHFIAQTSDRLHGARVTVYLQPEVAR